MLYQTAGWCYFCLEKKIKNTNVPVVKRHLIFPSLVPRRKQRVSVSSQSIWLLQRILVQIKFHFDAAK